MKVEKIIERKDGSADVTLSMTEQESNSLIEYAILDILKKEVKRRNKIEKRK